MYLKSKTSRSKKSRGKASQQEDRRMWDGSEEYHQVLENAAAALEEENKQLKGTIESLQIDLEDGAEARKELRRLEN